jgi:hypothetical protein
VIALLILHRVFVKKWLQNARRLSSDDIDKIEDNYFRKL